MLLSFCFVSDSKVLSLQHCSLTSEYCSILLCSHCSKRAYDVPLPLARMVTPEQGQGEAVVQCKHSPTSVCSLITRIKDPFWLRYCWTGSSQFQLHKEKGHYFHRYFNRVKGLEWEKFKLIYFQVHNLISQDLVGKRIHSNKESLMQEWLTGSENRKGIRHWDKQQQEANTTPWSKGKWGDWCFWNQRELEKWGGAARQELGLWGGVGGGTTQSREVEGNIFPTFLLPLLLQSLVRSASNWLPLWGTAGRDPGWCNG